MRKLGGALGALALMVTILPAAAQTPAPDRHAPKRPRIVIHPQRVIVEPPPTARRYCRSWLVQEYRESGTVIVPRMQCWWG